jgi:glutamate-1-semialdehyde 2,1-aminomutase
LPLQIENFGSLFGFTASGSLAVSQDSDSEAIAQLLIYYNLIDKGILLRGNGGFLSTAHTDEDINSIIQAVRDSITELRNGDFLC